jgi:hypothetical protein
LAQGNDSNRSSGCGPPADNRVRSLECRVDANRLTVLLRYSCV